MDPVSAVMRLLEEAGRLSDDWANTSAEFFDWPHGTLRAALSFFGLFPILVSLLWSISALINVVVSRLGTRRSSPSGLPTYSVLIPFYGDGDAALRTAWSLSAVRPYPEAIVLIDDGTNLGVGLSDGADLPPRARILRLPENRGKAHALNAGLKETTSQVIVCMDADTQAFTRDWTRMLRGFALEPKLGATTGKLRAASVRRVVQIFQDFDYLAVICMVKCAESLWGGLLTISGAWVAIRREALEKCGGWDGATSAEDIELSWRLQSRGWRVSFDLTWTARVMMAETWGGLWRQRRRWSSGLGRTLRDQGWHVLGATARHLPVALVSLISLLWMWGCLVLLIAAPLVLIAGTSHDSAAYLALFFSGSHALLYAEVFAIQFLVSILVDHGTWPRYPLLALAAPFYPLYFWFLLFPSFIAGFPRGFLRKDSGRWIPTALGEEPGETHS